MGKRIPPGMGTLAAERIPSPAKLVQEPTVGEASARVQAQLQKVPVAKLRAHSLQPLSRHADENVAELKESIRTLGLQEPPLVHRRNDGGYVILAGHRRVRAWQLLTLEGGGGEKINAFVREGLSKKEEVEIIAAEYFHREAYSMSHTAMVIGELWEALREEIQREPTRREMAHALPWGKSSVSAYLKVYEALQDPVLAPLVQRLDSPDMSLVYLILGVPNFALKTRALELYADGGAGAAKRFLAVQKKERDKPGRPKSAVTRRQHSDGGLDLHFRYRPSMSRDEIVALIDAHHCAANELQALLPRKEVHPDP